MWHSFDTFLRVCMGVKVLFLRPLAMVVDIDGVGTGVTSCRHVATALVSTSMMSLSYKHDFAAANKPETSLGKWVNVVFLCTLLALTDLSFLTDRSKDE